jgi:hypothetical protein
MTPWVVVALLAGFALGWVGRSVRAAAREWTLRCELADAEVEAAAATFAWAQEKQRADGLHKHLGAAFDVGFDHGWQDGAGIRVDLGGIEP